MNNNRSEATTKGGTKIDSIFSRYINNITSNILVSYFNYHKPIITIIKSDKNVDNNSTVEIV